MSTDLPTAGHREFEVGLRPDGSADVGDPADTTESNDAWTQDGCTVTVFMNDRFVAYEGQLVGGRIAGEATNIRDEKWDFVMMQR